MSDIKLCKDCKFRTTDSTCLKMPTEIDLVNGEQRYMPCDFARKGTFLKAGQDYCGTEGTWFEPIETSWTVIKGWWDRYLDLLLR